MLIFYSSSKKNKESPQHNLRESPTRKTLLSIDLPFAASTTDLSAMRRDLDACLQNCDRREAKKLLRAHDLSRIPLGPARIVDLDQAKHDAAREPCIFLNGVRFCGPEGVFLETLERVVAAMGGSTWVFETLLSRSARTSAGADSYFVLQHLLGLDDDDQSAFVVMPRHGVNTSSHTFSEDENDEPKGLEIALRTTPTKHVHARILCRNGYSLHRIVDDDDATGFSEDDDDTHVWARRLATMDGEKSPASRSEWLAFFTCVTEELTFDTSSDGPHTISDSRHLAISLDPHNDATTSRRRRFLTERDSSDFQHPPLQRNHVL